MKILHVINSLFPAGAESLVANIANKQVETEDVSIFTFYSELDVFDEKLDDRIRFYPHEGQSYISPSKIRHLVTLIRRHDIIHVHLFPPFYIVGFLAAFFVGKKFVYTEHNTTNRRRKAFFKGIEKYIYGNYDHVICISRATERSLVDWVGNKVDTTIITNFVNTYAIKNVLKQKRENFGFSPDATLLVMVGRFSAQKDQDTIIKALGVLPESIELVLIGIGERLDEVREMVINSNLSYRVHFMGARKDVISILKVCDYGILSSHWEGFGIAALEYIASDLLALGTNVDGLNEVITDSECQFNVGDCEMLCDKIIALEANTSLRDKIKSNQQKHLRNLDIDMAVESHFKVYHELKC